MVVVAVVVVVVVVPLIMMMMMLSMILYRVPQSDPIGWGSVPNQVLPIPNPSPPIVVPESIGPFRLHPLSSTSKGIGSNPTIH